MELIDGNEVASSVIRDLTDRVASFGEVKPRVTFIRVGDDPASISYLRKKEKTAKQIGIRSELKVFPISISQNDLLEEIDKLNILHATMLAMIRAVEGLPVKPDFVRVDGNRLPAWNFDSEAVVKGDSLHAEISAASIIAKVERDNDMISLHEAFPQYNFAGHKGYPTKAHFEAIAEYGILDCYRKSFKPVKALLEEK